MKYYIIAGEASGDLHGSNLIKELKQIDKNAKFRYWGGDLMKSEGGTLVKHYSELAFMGFFEVLLNLRTIFNNLKFCKKDIPTYHPDVLILIDYSGFNLRIAKFAKTLGFKVFYYISPKVWAWKISRIKIIKQYVDRMFVILPFEKDFYKRYNYQVDFVGNPLIDNIEQKCKNKISFDEFIQANELSKKPIIAILPGSRKQEIDKNLPVMLGVVNFYKEYQFIIAAVTAFEPEYYERYLSDKKVKLIYNKTYEILQVSVAALVVSGTATLETALFNVPQVVCYKAGNISFQIAKRLVKVKYISLFNLIMDKEMVRELIQNDLNISNLKEELDKLLYDDVYRKQMIENYKLIRIKLGGRGASQKAAELMYGYLLSY